MNDLRASFHRVADAVEPLPVDDDLWQRGVAARRRGQAFLVAAVLALVVSIGGFATLTLGDDGPEARTASTEEVDGGAIPSRIEDIPADLEVTTDLAVGRGSAAFISASGDPVVITAADGVPHRLRLPGWNKQWVALALSPDGRTLAYQQEADGPDTRVVLLDLETGDDRPLVVHWGDALKLDGLGWSPRGAWLAWVASAIGETPPFFGQVALSRRESLQVAAPANVVSIAIAEDGTTVIGRVSGGLYMQRPDGDLSLVPGDVEGAAGAFSPDGRYVALGSAPGTASYTLDMGSRTMLEHPFPDGTLGRAVVRPLGWLDDRLQLLLVQELDGEEGELVVTTPEVDRSSTWRRSVGEVDFTIARSVSLAVDLIPDLDGTSTQPLTHDFGEASPDSDGRWTGLLGLAFSVALLVAYLWWAVGRMPTDHWYDRRRT